MDITDIFNIKLCDKNAPWVYCHIVERISSAIWVSSGPKAAINIKWNRDEEENLNAVAEESENLAWNFKIFCDCAYKDTKFNGLWLLFAPILIVRVLNNYSIYNMQMFLTIMFCKEHY